MIKVRLQIKLAFLEKAFTTEAQRARRRKMQELKRFFSANFYDFLSVLRVSVIFQ